jgi:hypothetical protein
MLVAALIAAWIVLAIGVAVVIGCSIRMADRRAPFTDHLAGLPAELTVADILGARATQPST